MKKSCKTPDSKQNWLFYPLSVLSTLKSELGKREKLTIFGSDYNTRDGTGERDYIHVSDLASAHTSAYKWLSQNEDNLILNCGYGRGSTVLEVLDVIQNIAGSIHIEKGPRRAGDPASIVSDCAEIRRTLNWRPKLADLNVIIGSALDWEKRKP